jgi:hypothetical protein
VVFVLIGTLWLWRKISGTLRLRPQLMYLIAAYAMGSVATYWTIDRTLVLF